MDCLGECNKTSNECQVCILYDRCLRKTSALIEHEYYINDLYKKFKIVLFNAAAKGNFFDSTQLMTYLEGQIDKDSKRTIAKKILTMASQDSSFRIENRRIIPIKSL